ncbi:hypothetical protein AMK68_02195 [candidate division KD3-62 bacterium DG_56]|uniref:Ferrous iron transporter FeoA-like domain-containing protein n=1 Tax=candidate division KD3-62 bacterium DG_56 TaxID=1704032 RepID=A0A0S7XNS7_9BACT|nr:MAG: hypothetical protein AMK68_02195 [candidate division KD3-62 bacterium DG_56]
MVTPPAQTSLALLAAGQVAIVRSIQGGWGIVRRLAALGIVPGTPVTVLSNSPFGPMIVEVRGSRLALGRREATRIIVAPKAG